MPQVRAQATPESAGSPDEAQCGSGSSEGSPLAAGSSMRKLVLPDLDEPAHESEASLQRMPAAPSRHSEQQDAANAGFQDSNADVSASPEVFTARRQHGRGGRRQHVLADSDEDSPGSSPAAAAWANNSSEVTALGTSHRGHCNSVLCTLFKYDFSPCCVQ